MMHGILTSDIRLVIGRKVPDSMAFVPYSLRASIGH